MNKPLASIAVPTKNRYCYLKSLVLLLDTFNTEELELVIQDNSDDNSEILSFFNENHYSFVSYYYSEKKLTMTENCDLAIKNSKGDYVCLIGDDDCVTNNFIPCVKWMRKNGVECVFPRRIMYFWPDYCDNPDERAAVHYEPFKNEAYFYNTKEVLKELLDCGCIGIANMPLVYQGVVRRDVLEKIWNHCGSYMPGSSPDIASGVSLCMVINKYASFRFPIVIAGNSRPGGGGQKVMKHHGQTDFSKLPFLPSNIEEIWDPRIPKVWTNPTIWCESVVEALNTWNRKDLVEEINFERLYSYFAVNYSYYWRYVFALTNNKLLFMFSCLKGALILIAKNIVKCILRIMKIQDGRRIKVFGINDINELCKFFERKGLIFNDCISNV